MADGTELVEPLPDSRRTSRRGRCPLPEEMDDLRTAIGGIGISRIETVALCVPAGELSHLPPLAGLIAVDDDFYSMVSRDYLPDERYRGFAFHFRHGALTPTRKWSASAGARDP